jgi:hypothetical protein
VAKDASLKLHELLIGTLLVLGGANFLAVKAYQYPFVYCWAEPLVAPLYISWGLVILYMACAYTAFQLLRRRTFPALGGALFFIAIIELPRLADMVFRLGGSCG